MQGLPLNGSIKRTGLIKTKTPPNGGVFSSFLFLYNPIPNRTLGAPTLTPVLIVLLLGELL